MSNNPTEKIPVSKQTWDKSVKYKSMAEKKPKENHFDRVKVESRKSEEWNNSWSYKTNIYFDCETFEYFEDPSDPNKLPIIVPYLIGAYINETDTYVKFVGVDATWQFLEWLTNEVREVRYANLIAFNLDYDFQAIRPILVDGYQDKLSLVYEMSEKKKFNHGEITPIDTKADPIYIKYIDLWRWDTTKSLDSYLDHIVSITYDKENNHSLIGDGISKRLDKLITEAGYTYETLKKQENFDYHKINLFKEGDDWYYYSSEQDLLNKTNVKKLDLDSELKYLKTDVRTLPIVHEEIKLFRVMAKQLLGIDEPIDPDNSITLPGFGKYLFEEYCKTYMTEDLRMGVDLNTYNSMLDSYVGAFVCGNRDITYLDEEVFNKMYPGIGFYDEEGKSRIRSYDVNSMYPWAMHTGLPYGIILDFKPKQESVCWCEIRFLSETDPDNPDRDWRLYKWKPQYAYLNNTFFGKHFSVGIKAGTTTCNRLYVPDFMLKLFDEMCIADYKIVKKRYQLITKKHRGFIDALYKIKCDDTNSPSKIKCVKDILNSLYGKMAERFREYKIQWTSNTDAFVFKNKHILELEDVDIIDDKVVNTRDFKNTVAPYIDLTKKCGYFIVKNTDKRYDKDGNECREQITAGMYITWLSRWKLLSTIKGEIDQGNVVLYSDTDSIKMIQIHSPKFECHKSDLGAWKDEGWFTHFGHPNRHKKYWMHNKDIPEDHPNKKERKKRWMVKVSGISKHHLYDKNGKFDLEMIKTIYDPNNCVLIKNCRPDNKRNSLYQTVIRKTDFKFAFEDPKLKPTHVLDGGVITKI